MIKDRANDFTKPLMSEIIVFDDPNYDCKSHDKDMERIFDFG